MTRLNHDGGVNPSNGLQFFETAYGHRDIPISDADNIRALEIFILRDPELYAEMTRLIIIRAADGEIYDKWNAEDPELIRDAVGKSRD